MRTIFHYLVFPGFIFSAFMGLWFSWLERKVTARLQWRQGPPWYQNFADLAKLLGKECIIPRQAASRTFFLSPFVGLAAAVLASTIIWMNLLYPQRGFAGDLIVVLYLLTMPAVAVIMGGLASANPLASLGASREMKLILSYELPFILTCLVPVIKSGSLRLGEMVLYQARHGSFLFSFSGALSLLVAGTLSLQAKLGMVPFDVSEAEQEIMAGVYIEFSGPLLAVYKLTRQLMCFAGPLFLVILFWAMPVTSPAAFLLMLLRYAVVFTLLILIRNTNPRLRIDQAMRFFWGKVTIVALIAVGLALLGK